MHFLASTWGIWLGVSVLSYVLVGGSVLWFLFGPSPKQKKSSEEEPKESPQEEPKEEREMEGCFNLIFKLGIAYAIVLVLGLVSNVLFIVGVIANIAGK